MALSVETSGVVVSGRCEVRLEGCAAPTPDKAVTIVTDLASKKQIKVCGACLSKKIEDGSWEKAHQPPLLDLRSVEYLVRIAKEPANQTIRAETIGLLQKEIKAAPWSDHPHVKKMKEWLFELGMVAHTGELSAPST